VDLVIVVVILVFRVHSHVTQIITSSGVSKEEERIKNENESYDISKDPEAKF
jgi:hypothetical protein